MGLDMFAKLINTKPETSVDFELYEDAPTIAYWRKHPNLHGWMKNLYMQKGGTKNDFNVAPVLLTKDDLDSLEQAINTKTLPHTEGFFFGESRDDEVDLDREFIEKARMFIDMDMHIYYFAWW